MGKWFISSRISVIIQITLNPNKTPINGGKWVMVLKTGTNKSAPTPKNKTKCFSKLVTMIPLLCPFFNTAGLRILPLNLKETMIKGTSKQTILGIIIFEIIFKAVTCPPIHNIIVVTSPIGDHAPPALAAIISTPANIHKSCLFEISFLSNADITIAVVRLSSAADKKKVKMLNIQINFTLLVVLILSVITENPS